MTAPELRAEVAELAASWGSDLVWTPERLDRLAAASERLLAATGSRFGYETAPGDLALLHRQFVEEALGKALSALAGELPSPARRRVQLPLGRSGPPGSAPLGTERRRYALPLDPNTASRAELEALPGVGPKLAAAILAERDRRAGFTSVDELTEVPGLGAGTLAAIRLYVGVSPPGTAGAFRHPAAERFARERSIPALVELLRATGGGWPELGPGPLEEHLVAFVAWAARLASADPHPRRDRVPLRPRDARRRQERREAARRGLSTESVPVAGWVPLVGGSYSPQVLALLQGARERIDVLMFFFHLETPRDPTRPFLEALVAAHAAGRAVRVLLDIDREEDVYGSRTINRGAFDALAAAGVPVRFDRPERLTHSKLVLVDGRYTVIGSHNWTAGSFFQYEDHSVLLDSEPLARRYRERFDAAWQGAGA